MSQQDASPLARADLDAALSLQLSDAQWAAVSAPLEPAVIVAGAGTGKTTSMSARVAYLAGSGLVDANRVLGLTFTNKAASQLLSAIRRRVAAVGVADAEPVVSTYHAFAARLVTDFGLRIGHEPDATLLTDGLRHQHAYRLVCGVDVSSDTSIAEDLAEGGRKPVSVTQQMLQLDDELSELAITPEQVIEHDERLLERVRLLGSGKGTSAKIADTARARIVLSRLVQRWRTYKSERDLWDYSDQVRLARDIVVRFPETAEEIRNRFDVVLLDEYQDTSIGQRLLLQRLFAGGFPVTAVGDPCQAIYGWRGASVDNIESFPWHFPRSDGSPARRYALAENRRSGPAVLHVANEVATGLRSEHAGTEPLVPARDSTPARVDVGLFATIDDEVDYVAHRVREAHLAAQQREPMPTIAVLCTTGADIRRVDRALQQLDVPTQVSGAAALLADPAVADLRALMEVVHEPTANPSMVRLLSGARWRVGARDLAALGARASELAGGRGRMDHTSVQEALDEAVSGSDPVDVVSLSDAAADIGPEGNYSEQAVAALANITSAIANLRQHTGEPIVDFISRAMRLLGVDVEARVAESSGSSVSALADFLALAGDMTHIDGRVALGGFLARLRDAEKFDVTISHTRPVMPGAVQLMTVFAAKGLEFGTVFVPFVSKKAFPGGKSRGRWITSSDIVPWPLRPDVPDALRVFPEDSDDSVNKQHDRHVEELQAIEARNDERLAYVGLTRAEDSLTVTGHWWGASQGTPRGPHRFLEQIRDAVDEADPDLCRVVSWAEPPEDGASNPVVGSRGAIWPVPVVDDYRARLMAAAEQVRAARAGALGYEPALVELSEASHWDARVRLWHETFASLAEDHREDSREERVVPLGPHVGATTFLRALRDPDGLAVDLLRPMPRQPSPAASRGVAWHAWVETVFGQQSLWGMEDLPGAADAEIASDAQLEELKRAFERSRYAGRQPVAVERPFSLVVGGRVINGRMDAVFAEGDRFEVVDWKTGNTASIDPRQLAVYRLAWAQIAGVRWEDVDAAFVMVASGEEIRPDTDAEVRALLAFG